MHRAHLLLPSVLAAALLWPVLFGGFGVDDELLIVSNPLAHDMVHLRENLTCDYFHTASGGRIGYYRPASKVAYLLQYRAFGDNASGYHAISFVLWLLVLALSAMLLRSVEAPRDCALLTLSIFATHPSIGEPVGLIAAQSDLIAVIGLLLGLASYVRFCASRRAPWLLLALAGQSLALAAKELGVVLIVLAAVFELWCVPDTSAAPRAKRLAFAWFLLPLAAYIGLRLYLRVLPLPSAPSPLLATVSGVGKLTLGTFVRSLLPLAYVPELHLERPGTGLADVAGFGLSAALGLGALLLSFRRWPSARLPIALLIVPALPHLAGVNAIHVTEDAKLLPLADRWLILSALGGSWLIALCALGLLRQLQPRPRRLAACAGLILLAANAVTLRSVAQSFASPNARTEYLADLFTQAGTDTEAARYAIALAEGIRSLRSGPPEAAVAAYRAALALRPNDFGRHHDLAIALSRAGQDREAFEHAWIAFHGVTPDGSRTFAGNDSYARNRADRAFLLGTLLQKMGDLDAARAHYEACLSLNPQYPGARERLDALPAAR